LPRTSVAFVPDHLWRLAIEKASRFIPEDDAEEVSLRGGYRDEKR
jgi:hypothetical protein